jgi:hypothetical protein
MVQVPPQGELRAPLWVDVSCDACGVEAVSERASGAAAVLFRKNRAGSYVAATGTIDAPSLGIGRQIIRKTAHVAPTGDITLEQLTEYRSDWAADWCAGVARSTPRERHDAALGQIAELSSTARLERFDEAKCDGAEGSGIESMQLTLPGHAVVEPDRVLVPMTLLSPMLEYDFSSQTRRSPIAFTGGRRRTEQHVDINLMGWTLENGIDEDRSAPGLHVTAHSRATPTGATLTLTLDVEPGVYPVSQYDQYRRLTAFLRDLRARLLVFRRGQGVPTRSTNGLGPPPPADNPSHT